MEMASDDIFTEPDLYAAEAEVRCLSKLLLAYGLGEAGDRRLKAIAESYASRKRLSLRNVSPGEGRRCAEWSIVVTGLDGVHFITAYGRSSAGALRNLVLWIFQHEGVSSADELEIKLDLEAGMTA